MRGVGPAALLWLAACGGSQPAPKATEPTNNAPAEPSIGETAVENGGLSSFAASSESGVGAASAGALKAQLVDRESPVKIDGVLGEWPARSLASVVVKGSSDKLSFAVAVQYDSVHVFIGGEVADASFVRTNRFAEGEDHASLVLAFPSGSSFVAYEVGLFAGKPGEISGEVRFIGARHGHVAGSKIVEAPWSPPGNKSTGAGYSFEASIPWSAFPEARTVRVGLRGAARYYDSDGSRSARNVIATGEGEASAPASLPPLLTESEQSMLEGLLEPKGLAMTAPKVDLIADVVGDAMKERISVFDHFFTICGPAYRGGKEFFFRDLGAELIKLEAREVTGRRKADLVVRRRFTSDGATRDWFEVWSLLGGDEPVTTFGHEVAVARDGKRVEDPVRIAGRDIEVTHSPASGWDASTYREPVANDVEPILLPWGTVRAQTFRFDGTRFKKSKEVAQAGVAPKATAQGNVASMMTEEPKTPAQRPGGDLSKQVLEQYERDHGVPPGTAPKIDLQVNVDGDGQPERVALIGRDIVVFGPGFQGGTQYAFLTLQQFADPADVRSLTARDVTGDGAADLVVRGVRHIDVPASEGPVNVDAMFLYQVKGAAIAHIFAIETARAVGAKRMQGLVQFIPSRGGRGFDIDARPGRATGWTAKTFPWAQEQPGSGAVEPLILPWGGIPSVRYAWNGSQFAPSP